MAFPEFPLDVPVGRVRFGMTFTDENAVDDKWETPIGKPLPMYRRFFSWAQAVSGNLAAETNANYLRDRATWLSFKTPTTTTSWADVAAGDYDTELDAILSDLKDTGIAVWLTPYHEPEDNASPEAPDNGKEFSGSASEWKAMFRHVEARRAAVGADNVLLVPVYMDATFDAATDRDIDEWLLLDAEFPVIGIDPYTSSFGTSPARITKPLFNTITSKLESVNKRIAISECGGAIGSSTVRQAGLWQGFAQECLDHDILACCWYDIGTNEANASPGDPSGALYSAILSSLNSTVAYREGLLWGSTTPDPPVPGSSIYKNGWVDESYVPGITRSLVEEADLLWISGGGASYTNEGLGNHYYTYTILNTSLFAHPIPPEITHVIFYHASFDNGITFGEADSLLDILAAMESTAPTSSSIQLPDSISGDSEHGTTLTLVEETSTYAIYELTTFPTNASFDVDFTVPINDEVFHFFRMGFLTGPSISDNYPGVTDNNQLAFYFLRSLSGGSELLPPVAQQGTFTPAYGDPDLLVRFDGTTSYDSDGTIVSYSWDFGDSTTGTGPTPVHLYSAAGEYTVTLTVEDNDGLTDVSVVTLTVSGVPEVSTGIQWHTPGSRIYETGIDRGAIYLRDGRVVPWNGLVSVNENLGQSSESVFYDGVKLSELQSSQGFSAAVKAITYPDELEEVTGAASIRRGVHLWDQPSSSFGFTYRTLVGNELEGLDAGYKIHLVYNISAVISDREYTTLSDEVDLIEFEWDFVAVPEHIDGYRPSTHLIIDTSKATPSLVALIESYIYGTATTPPVLPPLSTMIALIMSQDSFINIVDNGDGTWTASTNADGYINDLGSGLFEIQEANIVWIDSDTYIISPTPDPPIV